MMRRITFFYTPNFSDYFKTNFIFYGGLFLFFLFISNASFSQKISIEKVKMDVQLIPIKPVPSNFKTYKVTDDFDLGYTIQPTGPSLAIADKMKSIFSQEFARMTTLYGFTRLGSASRQKADLQISVHFSDFVINEKLEKKNAIGYYYYDLKVSYPVRLKLYDSNLNEYLDFYLSNEELSLSTAAYQTREELLNSWNYAENTNYADLKLTVCKKIFSDNRNVLREYSYYDFNDRIPLAYIKNQSNHKSAILMIEKAFSEISANGLKKESNKNLEEAKNIWLETINQGKQADEIFKGLLYCNCAQMELWQLNIKNAKTYYYSGKRIMDSQSNVKRMYLNVLKDLKKSIDIDDERYGNKPEELASNEYVDWSGDYKGICYVDVFMSNKQEYAGYKIKIEKNGSKYRVNAEFNMYMGGSFEFAPVAGSAIEVEGDDLHNERHHKLSLTIVDGRIKGKWESYLPDSNGPLLYGRVKIEKSDKQPGNLRKGNTSDAAKWLGQHICSAKENSAHWPESQQPHNLSITIKQTENSMLDLSYVTDTRSGYPKYAGLIRIPIPVGNIIAGTFLDVNNRGNQYAEHIVNIKIINGKISGDWTMMTLNPETGVLSSVSMQDFEEK